jgi:hypothetical protein
MVAMDEQQRQSAFMSALTTEHFVLQTAASATIFEAGSRSSLYVLSLSSSLVAIGFASQSPAVFMPFIAAVLPAVFLVGIFTIFRLVDITVENMRCLAGIAHIRGYYRALTPEAAMHFSAERGRWPETRAASELKLGTTIAFLTTSASVIAFINSFVAGAGVALLLIVSLGTAIAVALLAGVAIAALIMLGFFAYERWRFRQLMVVVP